MFLTYKTINQVDESLQLIQPWLIQAKVIKLSVLTVTTDAENEWLSSAAKKKHFWLLKQVFTPFDQWISMVFPDVHDYVYKNQFLWNISELNITKKKNISMTLPLSSRAVLRFQVFHDLKRFLSCYTVLWRLKTSSCFIIGSPDQCCAFWVL